MISSWRGVVSEIAGVALIALTVLVGLSLLSHNPADPSFNSYLSGASPVQNYVGIVGASISDMLIQIAGVASWIFVPGLFFLGIAFCSGVSTLPVFMFLAGYILLINAIGAATHIHWASDPLFTGAISGGIMGKFVAEKMIVPWFSIYGSYVVLIAVILSSVLLMTRISFSEAVLASARLVWRIKGWIKNLMGRLWSVALGLKRIVSAMFFDSVEIRRIKAKKKEILAHEAGLPAEGEPIHLPPAPNIANIDPDDESFAPSLPAGRKLSSGGEKSQQEIFRFPKGGSSDYESPPIKLLDAPVKVVVRQSRDDLIKSSRILERKLMDFGIEGRVVQVTPGPSITVYEFEPAPGVKVSRIVSLADDLAMSLRAVSIRILAPVPGKPVVGIETPNAKRESVFLNEMIASSGYQESDAGIPLALGKDISGTPLIVDLAQIPHLLMAGSTGSGKSVGINAMILSILYNASPDEIKFIMIDPKMLELSIYDGIPHLISPVVTNPKKAAQALRWAVKEMERRYAKLSEMGTRNITSYNNIVGERLAELAKRNKRRKKPDEPESADQQDEALEKLPYIVVVIDELADLMMVSSKEVEDSLTRLAQMARAAGIHLIVATQRPSVDVLTGLIKANFPARISFQVRSRVDSRTIIDSMGAEKLLGKGDMIYLPPGTARMSRIQAPFVSDAEIHRVVGFLKKQMEPVYNEEILNMSLEEEDDQPDEEMDEFYDQAIDLVSRSGQASISMIQRRLKIGYNRAARIVETMERQGIVGPSDGSKPREVYARSMDDY